MIATKAVHDLCLASVPLTSRLSMAACLVTKYDILRCTLSARQQQQNTTNTK
eukprot:m.337301 g.337301  ORF g.337301 m.337301 type:complete len:52 (-) comp18097_c0_seq1:49-204(-)